MSTTGDEPEGDYSYDMAHDDVSSQEPESAETPADSAPEPAEPVGSDGDYSYDLAHEVPPSQA
jgi:hypothetical protein